MKRWAFLVAAALGAAACGGADVAADESDSTSVPFDPMAAQMNDVSVLLPLPADEAGLSAMVAAGAPARGGELLPRAQYEAAFGEPGTLQAGGTPAAPHHETLRLVSFRIDPCFGAIGEVDDHAACDNQVRAVFQPVRVKAGAVVAEDAAVHVFYALTRDELARVVDALVEVRLAHASGDLGPLGVHPLADDADVARGLSTVLTEAAGAENLTRVTLFTSSGLGTAWNFSGFDFTEAGATRMELVDVPAGTEVVAFFKGFTPGVIAGDPAFTPPSSAPFEDNMQVLGNADEASRATAEERQAAFDALVRIESPDHHSPDTTDCASCHVADPVRRMVAEGMFDLVPSVLADVLGKQTEATVDAELNVHMFSYVDRQASVHRRTVQETAGVVAYVNEHVR